MSKFRVLITLSTIIIVGTLGYFVSLYARGYRLDTKTLKFSPSGLLVLNSDPNGAQVFIDGELKTATNTTLSLAPGTYDVSIKKDGYFAWNKRLTIDKEIVTQATANLFKTVPSFSPVTFSGASNPISSEDSSKIAYAVPLDTTNSDKAGLWILDTFSLPIGFSQGPRRITDGDLKDSTYVFSPDGRQILLTASNGVFLLDTGTFTPQNLRVNVASKEQQTLDEWANDRKIRFEAQVKNLPPTFSDILQRKTRQLSFSPDETMVMYTASSSAEMPDNLIPLLPGSSTQKQDRSIKQGNTYVYDIKEDRNFLISDQGATINSSQGASLRWFPTSRHILLAEDGKITIMDYDGTNRQSTYSGSYIFPDAYPYIGTGNLLILTNLGSDSSVPNLYSLNLK